MKNFKNFFGKCRTKYKSIRCIETYLFPGSVLALILFALVMNTADVTKGNLNNTANTNYTILKHDYEISKQLYFKSLSDYNKAKVEWIVSRQRYMENKNDENYKIFVKSTKKYILNMLIVLENYNEMLKKRVLSDNSLDEITKKEEISRIDILLDKIRIIKKQVNNTSQPTPKELKNLSMELKEIYAHSQHIRGLVVTSILKNKAKTIIVNLIKGSLKMNDNIAQLKASGYDTTKMEKKLCMVNKMLNQSYANYQQCANLMNLSTSESLAEAENIFRSSYKLLYVTTGELKNIYDSIPDEWMKKLESANSTYIAKGDGKGVINITDKADIKIYIIGNVTLKGNISSAEISLKNLKEIEGKGKTYGGKGNIEIIGKDLIIEVEGKDINIAIVGNGNAVLTGTGTQKACNKGVCKTLLWEGKNIKFSK